MMFTAITSRAARVLLGWSQNELAQAAQVGRSTVIDFENEKRLVAPHSVTAMERAFTAAGIEFLNHGSPGVQLMKAKGKAKR